MASPFGNITNPLEKINPEGYGDLSHGGLIDFLSNMIKFITIGAGLFAFINLIIAGFAYISAGSDSKKTTEAWSKIYMSLVGLVVIVASYTLAGIIGIVLFNDPTAILQPTIYGPGEGTP